MKKYFIAFFTILILLINNQSYAENYDVNRKDLNLTKVFSYIDQPIILNFKHINKTYKLYFHGSNKTNNNYSWRTLNHNITNIFPKRISRVNSVKQSDIAMFVNLINFSQKSYKISNLPENINDIVDINNQIPSMSLIQEGDIIPRQNIFINRNDMVNRYNVYNAEFNIIISDKNFYNYNKNKVIISVSGLNLAQHQAIDLINKTFISRIKRELADK